MKSSTPIWLCLSAVFAVYGVLNVQAHSARAGIASTWPPIPFSPALDMRREGRRDDYGADLAYETQNNFNVYDNSGDNGNGYEYYRAITSTTPSMTDILAELESLRNNSRVRALLQSSSFRVRCSCPQVTCNCGTATALQQAGTNETTRCVCDCATAATTHAVVAALTRRQAFACPAGTFSDLSSFAPSKCYFLSSAISSPTASLADAAMQCKQMSAGPTRGGDSGKGGKSKLAEPSTEAEARTLLDIIAREGGEGKNAMASSAFWSGIFELVAPTTSQLLYVSNMQPLPQNLEKNLRATLKAGDAAHDCYAIERDGKGSGAQWSNRDCSEMLRYVCEMEPSVVSE